MQFRAGSWVPDHVAAQGYLTRHSYLSWAGDWRPTQSHVSQQNHLPMKANSLVYLGKVIVFQVSQNSKLTPNGVLQIVVLSQSVH